jgi:Spy/CpxP family protein refolding chaperone
MKAVFMKKNQYAKAVVLTGALFCLGGAPAMAREQSGPPGPAPSSNALPPAAHSNREFPLTDDFAGIKLSRDQRVRIDQIHQDIKSRREAVSKEEKLTADQKSAMLEGYQRIERSEIFKVLTPEQQKEVLQRIRARNAAKQATSRKQSPPK